MTDRTPLSPERPSSMHRQEWVEYAVELEQVVAALQSRLDEAEAQVAALRGLLIEEYTARLRFPHPLSAEDRQAVEELIDRALAVSDGDSDEPEWIGDQETGYPRPQMVEIGTPEPDPCSSCKGVAYQPGSKRLRVCSTCGGSGYEPPVVLNRKETG